MQWGWNPDTVAAVTTALAAVAAVVAGVFAWGAYRIEREREQRVADDAKRQQAQLISAWAVNREDADSEIGVELHVQNLSTAPVYEVSLGIEVAGKCSYAGWARVIPPSRTSPLVIPVTEERLKGWRQWAATRSRKPAPAPYVEFTFCDTAGSWWHRDTRGALAEIDREAKYRY
jgi:hypothetical protein